MPKKIAFITGTRADFGKIKSLIEIIKDDTDFEVHIFATGMHMNSKYGKTVNEIIKCGYQNIYQFINHHYADRMDLVLAKTVEGFSHFVNELNPDLIVVHGDRVEAMAGSIVGAINNILVAHIEGGEVSGTVDEFLRHSISKMSHLHFVSNQRAADRLVQMGEDEKSVYVIGSPDLDIMNSEKLPSLDEVRRSYEIPFEQYGVLMFHPVTTEFDRVSHYASELKQAVLESEDQFVVIYPNNDHGSEQILEQFEAFKDSSRIKMIPSMRFEYFLSLLKNAEYILGNSSAGVREAPFYGIPTVNIGSRQKNRSMDAHIIHCGYGKEEILKAIREAHSQTVEQSYHFGKGNSDQLFYEILKKGTVWEFDRQKFFCEREFQV